ncbi:hypothetical protein BJF82_14250 [Kytococcus sp. CUA-901]|nr:hypothetical protein BJF82_14250 [Kytococcus sp. CUA-901]
MRKCSFMGMDDAVERTGMEYGGITPVGLPHDWPVLVDARVLDRDRIVIGSGVRRSKLRLPGAMAAHLPAPGRRRARRLRATPASRGSRERSRLPRDAPSW